MSKRAPKSAGGNLTGPERKSEPPLITGSRLAVLIGIALFAVALFFGWRLWDARNQILPARIRLNATATNVAFVSTTEDAGRILRAIDSSSVYVRNFARADLGPGSIQPPSKPS